jgi:hypothetical protein
VSKERARRRALREREAAARRAAAQRHQTRTARRRAAVATVGQRLPRRTRWGRHQGLLARRRRVQNGVILCVLLASQLVVWLITPDPWIRGAAALLAVFATPVLVTLVLDRRP